MGRNKHNNALATAAVSRAVKERHQRSARDNIAVPRNLVALPEKTIKSKHQSYFQFFENKDRKEKKLEFQVTTDPNPPPGFEFVPSGNPELTNACKELSREQDALIFIVSAAKDAHNHDDDNIKKLALHVHRMGHHVRRTIVEQAKGLVGKEIARAATDNWQLPDTQEEINEQAEAALRDLFPRIPNFDKQIIIEHSFRKGQGYGKPKVGTSELPLYRRVQLAVLAHIRHTHTRYDQLLKEVDWHIARKVVEETCLDILVKWRGDEETGRDQLDDILREVVVISDDSDSDDSDDSDDDGDDVSSDDNYFPDFHGAGPVSTVAEPAGAGAIPQVQHPTVKRQRKAKAKANRISKQLRKGASQPKKHAGSKKNKRGFKRYEAVQKRWEEAVHRNRHAHNAEAAAHASLDKMASPNVQQRPSVEVMSPMPRLDPMRDDRVQPISQQFHREGREYDHRIRSDDVSAANYHREEDSYVNRVHSDLGRPEGIVIGRRVARLPTDSRAAPTPGKLYHHGDLKDFLLPSIEPISPHSRLDAPQSVRLLIREESMRPEQVPAGQMNAPSRQHVPLDIRYPGVDIHNRPGNHGFRPNMVSTAGERVMPRYRLHYESNSQLHSTVEPREGSRAYRVREPIEDTRHHHPVPVTGTGRVIRIHREAPPGELWEAEPARRREPSPRRLVPYRRASPSVAYGATEHRHIEYRGAGASRFERQTLSQPQALPPGSARPLFYEVRSSAQAGSWHGSTIVRPEPSSATHPQPLEGSHDIFVRRPIQESTPSHRVPAEYQHRGYSNHEKNPSGHMIGGVTSAEPGNVEYLYEQQVPRRDFIIFR